jgi:peroxiredoxin Q/BCP
LSRVSAFDAAVSEFKDSGVAVVGVRNAAGVKEGTDASFSLVVDENDSIREEIGIEKDLFGLLGGRETYVLDASGTVVSVHNNQFDPQSHVTVALEAVESLPKSPVDEILDQIKEAVDGLQAAISK